MRRLAAATALAVGSLTVLAGCVPTPVPLRDDGDAGKTTSKAEWRVAAATTSEGPGIEIRMRNCATVRITSTSPAFDQSGHLRPVAPVADAKGKVRFSNASPIGEVRPGSQVIDTKTPQTDDLQRIIVPASGSSGSITVEPTGTTYQGYGSAPAFSWDVAPCTTFDAQLRHPQGRDRNLLRRFLTLSSTSAPATASPWRAARRSGR